MHFHVIVCLYLLYLITYRHAKVLNEFENRFNKINQCIFMVVKLITALLKVFFFLVMTSKKCRLEIVKIGLLLKLVSRDFGDVIFPWILIFIIKIFLTKTVHFQVKTQGKVRETWISATPKLSDKSQCWEDWISQNRSLVASRPWRFRMWRHLSSLGKFALGSKSSLVTWIAQTGLGASLGKPK